MNKLLDTSRVFYSYAYKHAEDGFVQRSAYVHMLRTMVVKYRKANNYPIGSQFNDEFEQNICENSNKPELCYDFVPPTLLQKASSFARAAAQWAKHGFKVRSEEEVSRIHAICKACPEYGGETNFLKIVCRVCGCSRLKLFAVGTRCPKNPPLWT